MPNLSISLTEDEKMESRDDSFNEPLKTSLIKCPGINPSSPSHITHPPPVLNSETCDQTTNKHFQIKVRPSEVGPIAMEVQRLQPSVVAFFNHWTTYSANYLKPCTELVAWQFFKSKIVEDRLVRKLFAENDFKKCKVHSTVGI
jgi:hypothetical protein